MKKVAFLLLLILAFSACGRGQNGENGTETENGGIIGVHAGDSFSLTISTPTGNANMNIEAAAASLTRRLEAQGIDVNINIETYIWQERDSHFERKLGQFAAGIGPDIFVLDSIRLYPFIENGFLQDIYTMIDASENWSREDFFENALRGHEINGRLYAMPMSFGFDFVGINANAPREFLDRFAELRHVSIFDLAELYLELIYEFPEWSRHDFISFVQIFEAINLELCVAVDYTGQTAGFPANFLERFETLVRAYDGNHFDHTVFAWTSEDILQYLQERYVFFRPRGGVTQASESFFDFQTTYFTDFVPLANSNGDLINTAWTIEVAVNAHTDSALAWAFIEELLSATSERGDFSANSHIARRYARHYLISGMETALTQFIVRPMTDSPSNAINQATGRIISYGDMPMSRPITHLFMPDYLTGGWLHWLIDGRYTAYETLSQMEEWITNWLRTERPPITP